MEFSLESIRPLLPPFFISVAGIVPIMILAEVRKMKKSFQVYLLTLFVILVWSIYLIAQCADMAIPAWRIAMIASFISTVLLLAVFIVSALALSSENSTKFVTLRMMVSIIALSTMTFGFSLLQVGDKLTILEMPADVVVNNKDHKVSDLDIRTSGADSSVFKPLSSRLDRIGDKIYCSLDSDWFSGEGATERALTIYFSTSSIPVEYPLQQISDLRKKAFAGYTINLSVDDLVSKLDQAFAFFTLRGIGADSIPKHPHISRGPHSADVWDSIRDRLEFIANDTQVVIRNTDGDLSFDPVPSGNDDVAIEWQWKEAESESPEIQPWCLWPPIWHSSSPLGDRDSLFRLLRIEELNSASEEFWHRLVQSHSLVVLSDELERAETIYFSKNERTSSPLLKKVEIEFFKSACSDLVQTWVDLGRPETAKKTMGARSQFTKQDLLAGKKMLDILFEVLDKSETDPDIAIRVDCASLYFNWLCFSFVGDLKEIPETPISGLTEADSFDNGIDIDDFRDGISKLSSVVQSADYMSVLDQDAAQDIRQNIGEKQLDQASLATLGAAITYANRQIRSKRKVVSQIRKLFHLVDERPQEATNRVASIQNTDRPTEENH